MLHKSLTERNDTAIHLAVEQNHEEIVDLLIPHYANLNYMKNTKEETPLDVCLKMMKDSEVSQIEKNILN